jgi:signal peptidase I
MKKHKQDVEKIKPARKPVRKSKRTSIILGLVAYALVLYYITNLVLSVSVAASASMEPTIMTGQHNVVNNFAYLKRTPQRGDVITFTGYDGSTFCKRVIGIAGDEIEFHNGYVYLNGEQLDESEYLDEDVETNCVRSFSVPDGCVFVMGDNRENSYDSRFWENPYVQLENIKSRVLFQLPF